MVGRSAIVTIGSNPQFYMYDNDFQLIAKRISFWRV